MQINDKNKQLNPKSYKDLFKEVASECKVHPDLVDDLIRFFYNEIRKELIKLEHTKILLPNLGTFVIRKGRLDRAIKRHKDMLGNMEKITYSGYGRHLPVKEKLIKMENAAERIKNELETKKTWKENEKNKIKMEKSI